MKDPVEVVMVSPLKSGLAEIKVWARSESSEFVAHPFITYPGEAPSQRWAVSHRRTGKAIAQYEHIFSRDDALRLADKFSPLADWKKLTRDGDKIEGWAPEEWTEAYAKVSAVIDDFMKSLAAEPAGAH